MSYYDWYDDEDYYGWDETGECIICGAPTQCIEHDYCYDCFCEITSQTNKNNNKTIIEKFKDEDFRKQWPAEFQCDDGHYVRSPYELIIDNWLYNHNIKHEYEKSVLLNKNPDDIIIADFYLPIENIYIEFWGIENNKNYTQRKENKIKLYDDNKIKRIDLDKEQIKRLNDILPILLAKYKK